MLIKWIRVYFCPGLKRAGFIYFSVYIKFTLYFKLRVFYPEPPHLRTVESKSVLSPEPFRKIPLIFADQFLISHSSHLIPQTSFILPLRRCAVSCIAYSAIAESTRSLSCKAGLRSLSHGSAPYQILQTQKGFGNVTFQLRSKNQDYQKYKKSNTFKVSSINSVQDFTIIYSF